MADFLKDRHPPMQIGDVLGVDYQLPRWLRRLNGWIVYDIDDFSSMPRILEPMPPLAVSWDFAQSRLTKLHEDAHPHARLPDEYDSFAIKNAVLRVPGFAEKAGIKAEDFTPYWGQKVTESSGRTHLSAYFFNQVVMSPFMHPNDQAYVRTVQDIPYASFQN